MAPWITGVSLVACQIYALLALVLAKGTAAGETVTVSATPVFPAIPWAQQRDDFEVLVHVEAPGAAKMHAPIDLVVAVDVSESMNNASPGVPSRLDLVKKAIKFVISKLDSSDRLAIVAFNDHVVQEYSTDLLRISNDGGCRARRKVEELTAGGRTAFKPALERAMQILAERPMEDDRLGFVLLVSDGIEEDSGGKWCSKEGLGRTSLFSKYPVHTFGFSASHDPKVLHQIAQASHGGTYYFVKENLEGITSALAVCLGGLKTVIAAGTRIKLTTPEQGGVEIKSIESGGYQKHVSSDRRWGEIILDALYAGEVKNFIVRLRVPEACAFHHHQQQQQLLLTLAAEYRSYSHAMGIDAISVDAGNAAVVHIQRPQQVVADEARQAPSPAVVSHIVLLELVELVAKFVRDQLADGVVATVDLGSRLESKWVGFKERHKFWSGVDLGGLDSDMSEMVTHLRREGSGSSGAGEAAAYTYSWLSSYRMQRATTMGSPEKVVPEFITPKMRLMLKEALKFLQEPILLQDRAGCHQDNPFNVNLEIIDRRLELWYKLKQEMPTLLEQPLEPSKWNNHLNAITQEASVEAINRAMHHDMYLAVVHASSVRRGYSNCGGREPAGTGTAC